MSVELEELFHELETPEMRVSSEAVVDAGQRKVRRRRALWGAGTGALAAAAAVAIALGTAVPNSSSTSPMPAKSTSAPQLGKLFTSAAHDGTFTSQTVSSGNSAPSPSHKYQVFRADGVLRIRLLGQARPVDLPVAARFADGGSASDDDAQTIVVRPVPRNTQSANLDLARDARAGGVTSDGVVLPDGSTAAVFVTEKRINPAKDVVATSWWTTSGQLIASTGEVAQVADLPGTFNGRALRGWSLPGLGTCGVVTSTGGGASMSSAAANDHGFCTLDVAFGDPAHSMTAVWMTVRPGPVSDLAVTPAAGAPAMHIAETPTGGSDVMLSAVASVTEKQYANGLVSTVTWKGPDGKTVTYRHDD